MKKVSNKKAIESKFVLAAFAMVMSIIAVGCDGAHFDEDTGLLVEASEDVAMDAPENSFQATATQSCAAWVCNTIYENDIPEEYTGALYTEEEYAAAFEAGVASVNSPEECSSAGKEFNIYKPGLYRVQCSELTAISLFD